MILVAKSAVATLLDTLYLLQSFGSAFLLRLPGGLFENISFGLDSFNFPLWISVDVHVVKDSLTKVLYQVLCGKVTVTE